MKTPTSWVVMTSSRRVRRFGYAYSCHFHCRSVSLVRQQQATDKLGSSARIEPGNCRPCVSYVASTSSAWCMGLLAWRVDLSLLPAARFEPSTSPSVEPAAVMGLSLVTAVSTGSNLPLSQCSHVTFSRSAQMSPRTESICGSRRNRVIKAAACVSVNIPSDRQLSLKPHVSVMWAGVS
jgi:hypothetical protein